MTFRRGALIVVGLVAAGMGVAGGVTATRADGSQQLDAAGTDALHRVDRERLLRDVTTLASDEFEGRRAGTAGGVKARAWIVNEMRDAGLTPGIGKAFVEPFTFVYEPGRGTSFPGLTRTEIEGSANVLGRIEGTSRGKWIVVSAHYDHLGVLDDRIYHGADDNASGVAALLAAARWLHVHPPRHPILFIAFDAEEFGSHGAKAFLKANILKKDEIAIDINLDMVSRNDKGELYASGTSQSPWLLPILTPCSSGLRCISGLDTIGRKPTPRAWMTGRTIPTRDRSRTPACRLCTSVSRITRTTTSRPNCGQDPAAVFWQTPSTRRWTRYGAGQHTAVARSP